VLHGGAHRDRPIAVHFTRRPIVVPTHRLKRTVDVHLTRHPIVDRTRRVNCTMDVHLIRCPRNLPTRRVRCTTTESVVGRLSRGHGRMLTPRALAGRDRAPHSAAPCVF
jgi:hypothetical protein